MSSRTRRGRGRADAGDPDRSSRVRTVSTTTKGFPSLTAQTWAVRCSTASALLAMTPAKLADAVVDAEHLAGDVAGVGVLVLVNRLPC
jgi:hypothetical protein